MYSRHFFRKPDDRGEKKCVLLLSRKTDTRMHMPKSPLIYCMFNSIERRRIATPEPGPCGDWFFSCAAVSMLFI